MQCVHGCVCAVRAWVSVSSSRKQPRRFQPTLLPTFSSTRVVLGQSNSTGTKAANLMQACTCVLDRLCSPFSTCDTPRISTQPHPEGGALYNTWYLVPWYMNISPRDLVAAAKQGLACWLILYIPPRACHTLFPPPSPRTAFQVTFALAFFALLKGNPGFETVWESMLTVFLMSIGEVDVPFSEQT